MVETTGKLHAAKELFLNRQYRLPLAGCFNQFAFMIVRIFQRSRTLGVTVFEQILHKDACLFLTVLIMSKPQFGMTLTILVL